MKDSYWGYWFIVLGIFVIVVMLLANDATTTNTQDYYQLKEVVNSAVYDSIDYSYYTKTREIRILKEVFVENFLRRFADTISASDTYTVEFYDLYESPPKVSVKISTTTAGFLVGKDSTGDVDENGNATGTTSLDVVNSIDLIVELNNSTGPCVGAQCNGSNPNDTPELGASFCEYYNS